MTRPVTRLASILAAGLLVAGGCDEAETPVSAPAAEREAAMSFRVDPALLGEAATLGAGGGRGGRYLVRPPARWKAIPDAGLALLRQAAGGGEGGPTAAFVADDGSGLFASDVPAATDDARLARMREADPGVRETRYAVNGLSVAQYLLDDAGRVRFVLVLGPPVGRQVRLDYVADRDVYPSHVAAIESSIGSIRPADAVPPSVPPSSQPSPQSTDP